MHECCVKIFETCQFLTRYWILPVNAFVNIHWTLTRSDYRDRNPCNSLCALKFPTVIVEIMDWKSAIQYVNAHHLKLIMEHNGWHSNCNIRLPYKKILIQTSTREFRRLYISTGNLVTSRDVIWWRKFNMKGKAWIILNEKNPWFWI